MVQKPPIQTENEACFYIVQDERFVDLNLYQVGCKQCRPRHRFGPTVPNNFLFHSVISGTGKLETGGQTLFLKPGQGFLLCPGQISTYYADRDDPWTYTWVEFDGMRARECMTLAGLSETQPVFSPRSGANLIQQFMATLLDNHEKSPIRQIGLGMILLDEIVQSSKTKIESSNKRLRDFYIKEAMGFIDQNYQRDVSVEEIAAASGLNRSYFGKLFKETMGFSPQQYLIQYRMTKAAELLKGSRIPVGEVARSVGYENQLHFSRAFKNSYGISPSQYRAKHFIQSGG